MLAAVTVAAEMLFDNRGSIRLKFKIVIIFCGFYYSICNNCFLVLSLLMLLIFGTYQATHFIVPDPICRTEKFFAAAASGR